MKDLIISLAADGRERYSQKVLKLEESIKDNWKGDVRIYKSFPSWCTLHSMVPYKFKYDLIERAKDEGYKRIYWLDSTMRLIKGKNIVHLLDQSKHGIVAFDNLGHPLKNYINDTAIKNLNISELDGVKQTWGGCVFWDFSKEMARLLFNSVMMQAMIGSFNEDDTATITLDRDEFIAHRHDQAVLSWLFHSAGIPLLDYGIIAAKKDVTDKTYIQYGD